MGYRDNGPLTPPFDYWWTSRILRLGVILSQWFFLEI